MDDNLEQVHAEWLRRLERCEVSREEVQGVLPGMKARLEFLRNLHSRIGDHADFAEAARDVEREIEQQGEEIKVAERYIERANGAG
jgi:hypothetical protein